MSSPSLLFTQCYVMSLARIGVCTLTVVVAVAVVVRLLGSSHDVNVMNTDFLDILDVGSTCHTVLVVLGNAVPSVVVGAIGLIACVVLL